MADITPSRFQRDPFSWVVFALALALVILWPGDVSWLMDEPRLIGNAWHANHDHQLALGGLYGNFGVRYGPLPTQIYQLLLVLTHDPFALVVLHGLLLAGVTGGALLWLARTLDLPGWFAVGVLLSPHVVAYERVLWDASFAVPVGAVALAAFADYLKNRRAWSLRLCLVASVLVPTIHPQALPLAGAILGWLGWRERAVLRQERRALGLLAVVVLVFNGYFFVQFAGQVAARLGGSMTKGYPGGGSHWLSALAPLLGGKFLCGNDYLEKMAPLVMPAWLHMAAQLCADLFYPLAWLGVLLAMLRAWKMFRRREAASELAPRESVMLVMLAGMLLQALIFGVLRIPPAPQYYFGTFALHALAALFAVDALRRWKWGALPGALYLLGAASLTMEAAWSIHQHGFSRPLWPTLASSVRVAEDLNHYSDTTAWTDVAVYGKAPQALRTLRLLLPPLPNEARGANGRLWITHEAQSSPRPGETLLSELVAKDPLLTNNQLIDVTPLPKDWVPDPSTW